MRKNILIINFQDYRPWAYISGIDLDTGELIRFVRLENPDNELVLCSDFLSYGEKVVGSVFNIGFIINKEKNHIKEYYIYNHIEPIRLLSDEELKEYNIDDILRKNTTNNSEILKLGNYKVHEKDVLQFGKSMEIIKVKKLTLFLSENNKCKARFEHKGIKYDDYAVPGSKYFLCNNKNIKDVTYVLLFVASEKYVSNFAKTNERYFFKFISIIKTFDKIEDKYYVGAVIKSKKYGKLNVIGNNKDSVVFLDENSKKITTKKKHF